MNEERIRRFTLHSISAPLWFASSFFSADATLMTFQVGPIIAGPMAEYSGWRNFWWLNVGLIGATFLICLFGFPETKYHRIHPDEIQNMVSQNTTEFQGEKTTITTIQGSDIEKVVPPELADLSHAGTAQRDPWLGKGRPSKQQFRLFQPNAHPFKSILLDLWIPWKLFAFPIVEFASFVVSWSASSFLTLNRKSYFRSVFALFQLLFGS